MKHTFTGFSFLRMNTDILYSTFIKHPLICTDTRKVEAGSIFFALSGPSFNGNSFAAKALELGCSFAVVDQEEFVIDERYILVNDTLLALQDLARHHRRKLPAKVIGITGSNGKTTSKELVRNVLATTYKTQATYGNLNNHIGVPLTLLQLKHDTEFAIIEMGASKQGDIKELVDIAEPDFGLITNLGMAHLEGMGGFEGVIKTKTELYDFLRAGDKMVFVNTMHDVFMEKASGMNQITFGEGLQNDVVGHFVSSDPFVVFQWKTQDDQRSWDMVEEVSTSLIGKYNFENLLAAACIGNYFGVSHGAIRMALSDYVPDNNRSQIIKSATNTIILDAYNANPTSLEAALRNFAAQQGDTKCVVIGKMMELGQGSEAAHLEIGQLALSLGFNQVYFVGKAYSQAGVLGGERHFENTDEAVNWFESNPVNHAQVLIKGSRSNQLERLKDLF